jgi:hypothetical protein
MINKLKYRLSKRTVQTLEFFVPPRHQGEGLDGGGGEYTSYKSAPVWLMTAILFFLKSLIALLVSEIDLKA